MLAAGAIPCPAQTSSRSVMSGSGFFSAIEDYFVDWFPRVTRIQSEQPHWVTPIVTVTPRLEEEFRYDQFWQTNPHGQATDNFGGGKGLELIPCQNVELILSVPAWIAHNGHIPHATKKEKPATDGWADETFLIKYRLLSANEENGNYIVTAFMGFSAPTGDDGNSNRHGIFTPRLPRVRVSAISTFRAPPESRCPTVACSGWVCRWLGTRPFNTGFSNISGRNLR